MSRSNIHLHANLAKDNKKRQLLLKQLMKVWSSKEVEQSYQNYFLNYLDSLPEHVVQIEITREIKKTVENRNHYFNTNKSLALHNTSLAKLRLAIERAERMQKISQRDVEDICWILDQLRNNNILVAQNTLKFNYEQRNAGIDEFGLLHGNYYIFQKINNDHGFLKNSFLRKYIQFTHAYDPFFLYHYESAKNGIKDNEFKSLPCVEKLFNLSVSKAYKIMKLQQEIMAFMAGKVTVEKDSQRSRRRKRYSFQVVRDRSKYNTTSINQYSNNGSIKIENKAYLQRKEEIEPYESPILLRSKTDVDENTIFNDRLEKSMIRRMVYNLAPIRRRESMNTVDQKIKFTQIPDNVLFKSRYKKMQSFNGEESVGRSIKVGGIRFSGTRKRDDDYRTIPPFRHYNPIPIKEEYLRSKSIEMPDRLEENDLHRDQPLQKKKNNFNFHNYNAIPVLKEQSNEEIQPDVGLQLRSFKMKAGNLTVTNLFTFLKELNIKQKYRSIFQAGNWEHSIRNNQYYLHKHYINQVLQAVSLCCALPETDLVVKYWGPTMQCDEETSQFLFKKLLEHIQRHTLCKFIYYNAAQMPQIYSSSFIKHKDRIYRKQRSLPMQIEYFSYYPFLSIDLSIITIPRKTSKEIQDNITVPSNVYSPFNQNEFVCMNYLLIINKLVNPGEFSKLGTFTPELESMREVQTKMIKEELTSNPYNLNSDANPVNLLTFRMRNPIFSAFFVANKPLLKFTGQQVYRDNQRSCIIVALKMLKCNTRLLFGKGFKNAMQMATILKTHNKGYKNIDFCVYMFAKRLRGRVKSIHLPDQICFGDLELVFEWKDFLKGRLQHDLSQLGTFGYNRQAFYCVLQIYNQNIFAFEVNQSNLI